MSQWSEVKAFLKWTRRTDLSSKLSLTCGGNVNYYIKVFIILFLLCLEEQETPWQFSKQISNFFFQLNFQIHSLLAQIEGERKAFFARVQDGATHCKIIPQEDLVDIKELKWKSLSSCEIQNNLTLPLFFIRSPYNWALQDMEFYDKLVDRFQDLSKVKNPAASKAKV